jgi:hypothetical protein
MQHPSLIFALGLLLGEIREPAMTERGSTPAMQPTCEGYERSSWRPAGVLRIPFEMGPGEGELIVRFDIPGMQAYNTDLKMVGPLLFLGISRPSVSRQSSGG